MIVKKAIISEKAIQDLEFLIQEYEDEYLKPFISERPADQASPVADRKSQGKMNTARPISEKVLPLERIAQLLEG